MQKVRLELYYYTLVNSFSTLLFDMIVLSQFHLPQRQLHRVYGQVWRLAVLSQQATYVAAWHGVNPSPHYS